MKIYFERESKIGLSLKTVTLPIISKVSAQDEIVSNVREIQFDLNGNTLILKGKIGIKENNILNNKINIVQNVKKKEREIQDDYSIIVYSIKPNDTLWDISKKFKVKQENIISSNDLEEPYNLNFGDKMYIVR